MGFFKARYVRDYMAARKIKSVFVWAAEIAAVVIAAVVITVGFGKTTVMQEGSMDPTLAAGDVVLINRAAYKIGEPKRGDIIAYRVSEEENASTHIKRIIGLPGETRFSLTGKRIRKRKIFRPSRIRDWQKQRLHWIRTNILSWGIIGTTVRIAGLRVWETSGGRILSVNCGLWLPPGISSVY